MNGKPRVALLIDADNSPASKIGLILNELSTFGETNVRRAYGNWKKNELKGWEEQLHEHAIRPMQQFDYSKGKNASDMAMVIDALDLLYTDKPEAFGIVSSDSDFTPLVMHLRAKGSAVYGFGARKTPEPFVNACSRFLFLDDLRPGAADSDADAERPQAVRMSTAELQKDRKLVELLRNAVRSAVDDEGWSRVNEVRQQIGNQASFDQRNYGYSTLTKLLAATDLFVLADEGKSNVSVRARNGRAAASEDSTLDWARPWYAPWRAPGEPVAAAMQLGASPAAALNAMGPAPVRFIGQDELPARRAAYEQFIFESGQCPVRPGLHDFFNGLVWLRFPQAKRTLNRLQAQEISRAGVGTKRGPVRDAITVFDENGALLDAPLPLWEALRQREWKRLFGELRPLWQEARLLVFGHALLEQLATPRKGLTAHVWSAQCPLTPGGDADAWLAARCTAQALAAKPFTPLPVLGVPGGCDGNENFSFYDDSLVFRPRNRQEQRTVAAPTPSART